MGKGEIEGVVSLRWLVVCPVSLSCPQLGSISAASAHAAARPGAFWEKHQGTGTVVVRLPEQSACLLLERCAYCLWAAQAFHPCAGLAKLSASCVQAARASCVPAVCRLHKSFSTLCVPADCHSIS